jgi:Flagellar biosynthesis protein, FliO
MNTQAENQNTATILPFSARIEPALHTEADAPVEKGSAKKSGGSRKKGTPRQSGRSATRDLAGDQDKRKAQSTRMMKSASAVQPTSPKRKTQVRKDHIVEQTAVHRPMEETPPGTSKASPERAVPLETNGGVQPARWFESEIQAEPSIPTQEVPFVGVLDETDWPGVGLLAKDTLRLTEPALQPKKRGLLTVTLRVRHSPWSVVLKSLGSLLAQGWNWTQQRLKSPRAKKRLRVCESVSLGEKRFVAVIQVDGEQFLVGGSASSVSTLAHLERSREFSEVFERHCKQDLSPA